MKKYSFYPLPALRSSTKLPVSSGTLTIEHFGHDGKIPVLFFASNPASGLVEERQAFFDQRYFQHFVVRFSCQLATTQIVNWIELVQCIEAFRLSVAADRWHVTGSGYSAALSVLYACLFPNSCQTLLINSLYTDISNQTEWLLNGVKILYPDFSMPSCWQQTIRNNATLKVNTANKWFNWERNLGATDNVHNHQYSTHEIYALADWCRLCLAFPIFANKQQLQQHIQKIRHIPTSFIQGRYDFFCPPSQTEELRRSWPELDYILVPKGQHSIIQSDMAAALIGAAENIKDMQ